MATNDHVVALVSAWACGDPARFRSVALQVAAAAARVDDGDTARRIRDTIDNAYRDKTYLTRFSGLDPVCTKCESTGASVSYVKDPDLSFEALSGKVRRVVEFMERACERCGYVWYERCADAGPVERDNPPVAG